MEKAQAAPKARKTKSFFKILPKAAQAAAVSFQNLPFSPRRDKHHHHAAFSGPIVSMIPAEARGRSKSSEADPEPGSPKVSCIGQIKCRSKAKPADARRRKELAKPLKDKKTRPAAVGDRDSKEKTRPPGIMKIFSSRRKSDASIEHIRPPVPVGSPPRLNQMRKFASSRDTLAGFDWTAAQIAPDDQSDAELCSDEDRDYSDGDDEVIIPFSAPILGSGGGLELEPRKEINLWKRRTMARPKPLMLNPGRTK